MHLAVERRALVLRLRRTFRSQATLFRPPLRNGSRTDAIPDRTRILKRRFAMKRLDLHAGATRRTAIFGLMLAVGALPGIVCGQSNSTEFVPFNRFLGSAKAATARGLMSRL